MDKRIVSLIASGTEIIWALGFGDGLVGRSHECDYPREVSHLPEVTWTKFDTNGRSYDIDQRVKAIVQEGLSVYGVDAEALKKLKPDVIVTQDHCQVCAVSLRDVEEAVCCLLDSKPQIVSLNPNSLSDIFEDIRKVAEALNAVDSGKRLIDDIQRRMDAVARNTGEVADKPRVVFIEWIEPLMAGGNWVPELIEMAGGTNMLGIAGKHSKQMIFNQLATVDPEVLIVAPCGFDIERTAEEMPALLQWDGWADLTAVKEDRVYLADGNQFFNRPGPRVAETLEICAEIIHPKLFKYGHEGTSWQKYMGTLGSNLPLML